jgi:hypothetical protein
MWLGFRSLQSHVSDSCKLQLPLFEYSINCIKLSKEAMVLCTADEHCVQIPGDDVVELQFDTLPDAVLVTRNSEETAVAVFEIPRASTFHAG